MGYRHLALAIVLEAKDLDKIPPPPVVELGELSKSKLRIYTRLTVCLSTEAELQKLYTSEVAKQYDLIAIDAMKSPIISNIIRATNNYCDILCLPAGERLPSIMVRSKLDAVR